MQARLVTSNGWSIFACQTLNAVPLDSLILKVRRPPVRLSSKIYADCVAEEFQQRSENFIASGRSLTVIET